MVVTDADSTTAGASPPADSPARPVVQRALSRRERAPIGAPPWRPRLDGAARLGYKVDAMRASLR
jgi:hypothetical protein